MEFPGAVTFPQPGQTEANEREGAGQDASVRRVKDDPGDGGRPGPIPLAPARDLAPCPGTFYLRSR